MAAPWPRTLTVMVLVVVEVSVELMADEDVVSMPSPAKIVTNSAELAVTKASSVV